MFEAEVGELPENVAVGKSSSGANSSAITELKIPVSH